VTSRVPVVDDNPVIRKQVTHHLAGEEYFVVAAENGLEGFKTVSREKPGLIISDFLMPEMERRTPSDLIRISVKPE